MDAGQLRQGFWLAEWWVKPDLSQLERDGMVVQLEPKVMAVLQTLASEPGEVFSRQALEDTVWQGTVVGYDALSKAINKLRDALGDDKKDPRYIQTISKKGYRLIAPVSSPQPPESKPAHPDTIATAPRTPARTRPTSWRVLGGALAAIALFSLAVVFWSRSTRVDSPLSPGAPAVAGKPTIVVLPFRNISPNEDDDYLAEGLTSDLTTDLSRLSALWVTASDAVQVYKDSDIAPEKIGRQLNARYVLGGEVNKIAQAIRINVRLTDLDSGQILWAERYDRQFTDLFAIQDEVTTNILESLAITLTNEEKQRIARRFTNNLQAYDYFLRGQSLIQRRTPEDNSGAREMYQKAMELDPNFGRAYAAVAMTYAIGFNRLWPSDVDRPLEKALELAQQAIELDKDLPESYWVAGFVYGNLRKTSEAIEFLEQALELNPNYADAYAMLAWLNINTGEPEMALENMELAFHLNPSGGFLYEMQIGKANYFLDNHDLAVTYLTKAREGNPVFIDTLFYLAAAYASAGRYDDAGWMISEAKNSNPYLDSKTWLDHVAVSDERFRLKLKQDLSNAEAAAY